MELGGGGGGSVDSPHSDEEMERVMVSAEEEGESLIEADGSDEEMGGGGSSSAIIGGRVESLEIGDGLSDKSSSAEPEVMNRGPRYPLLNEEFAVGNECKGTWAQELGGGVCDALCVAVEDDDPTAGCNQVTACLCGLLLKAERVGNMPVLYARRPGPGKPSQLVCLVGPFWPCLMGVTYPLILGVSLFSAVFLLPDAPVWAVVAWAICTVTLVAALSLTACTNPGIVRRYRDEPPPNTTGWRWSDQAQTYRPPRSSYDRDCGVVIEEFDHTCPWTGTGIGKANMPYFSTFVSCVCICLIFNILLMVGIFADQTGPP